MNFKKLAVLSALALTLVLGLIIFATGAVAAAPPLTVGNATSGLCPHVFTSIQDAVTVASAGDTIQVCPGTYNVSQIIIDKKLTLQGAGASVTTIDGGDFVTGSEPGTIFIQDTDSSSPVTIDGFTFINPSNWVSQGEIVSVAASANKALVTISHNHFIGESVDNVSSLFDNAIWMYWPQGAGTISITDNEFDHSWQSILVELPNPGVTITGNNFHDLFTSGSNPPQALSLWAYGGLDVTNPITVSSNTFSKFDGWSIVLRGGGASVGGTENAQFINDVTIQNNNITADGAGIVLRNPASTLGDAALDGIVGATISGNTITGTTPTGAGIWLRGANNNASITGNTITKHTAGILNQEYLTSDGASSGTVAHENSFSGNTAGVSNLGTFAINATCNWWGAANGPGPVGPGSGDKVSPNVAYSPWLTSPAPSACNGQEVTNENQCKDGGWKTLFRADGTPFKNQGACIQYIEDQKDKDKKDKDDKDKKDKKDKDDKHDH